MEIGRVKLNVEGIKNVQKNVNQSIKYLEKAEYELENISLKFDKNSNDEIKKILIYIEEITEKVVQYNNWIDKTVQVFLSAEVANENVIGNVSNKQEQLGLMNISSNFANVGGLGSLLKKAAAKVVEAVKSIFSSSSSSSKKSSSGSSKSSSGGGRRPVVVAGGESHVHVPTREEKLAGAESGVMNGLKGLLEQMGKFVKDAFVNAFNETNAKQTPKAESVTKSLFSNTTTSSSYVVERGDTLSDIARKHGMTVEELYEYNKDVIGDNPGLIKPGQELKFPSSEKYTVSESFMGNDTPNKTNENYVVQKGDTLSDIARKHGMTVEELYELNEDVIGDNPGLIKPGQVLKFSEEPESEEPKHGLTEEQKERYDEKVRGLLDELEKQMKSFGYASQDQEIPKKEQASYGEAVSGIRDFVTNGSDLEIYGKINDLGNLYSGELKEAIDSRLRELGKEHLIPQETYGPEWKPESSSTPNLSQNAEEQKQGLTEAQRKRYDEKVKELLEEKEKADREYRICIIKSRKYETI